MIYNRKELKECLNLENSLYSSYMFPTLKKNVKALIMHTVPRMLWEWQKKSRKSDYYDYLVQKRGGGFYRFMRFYYDYKKGVLAERLGLEIVTSNIGPGLMIYHRNNVINSNAIIGKNLKLHGNNVIGNNGISKEAPIIGDNVRLGIGAKVIGNIIIANNITIAAGAVVVHSFVEPSITIAGIPAKKINR